MLEAEEHIRSATQLGERLRILVDKNKEDAESWLMTFQSIISAKHVRPNLEDVFVSVTSSGH
jgi:ABC-2 type transport system ATP-binding protein